MGEKILILGLGNTILSDDAVGIYAVRELKKLCGESVLIRQVLSGLDIAELSAGGIGLLDAMTGYRRVIIIDSIQTFGGPPGTITHFLLDEGSFCPVNGGDPHSINVQTAVRLGLQCGYDMPERIEVYSIEAADGTTFSEKLTQTVAAALSILIRKILENLAEEKEIMVQDKAGLMRELSIVGMPGTPSG